VVFLIFDGSELSKLTLQVHPLPNLSFLLLNSSFTRIALISESQRISPAASLLVFAAKPAGSTNGSDSIITDEGIIILIAPPFGMYSLILNLSLYF
jgi:hypothetical protein